MIVLSLLGAAALIWAGWLMHMAVMDAHVAGEAEAGRRAGYLEGRQEGLADALAMRTTKPYNFEEDG
jgi:threonine/homoserine/homoserine lactone efflux protein